MPSLRYAAINVDDHYGRMILDALPGHVQSLGYGLVNDQTDASSGADIRGRLQHIGTDGMTLQVQTPWGQGTLSSHLYGRFNASNLLAVLAALLLLGVSLEQALQRLAQTRSVAGRMEKFGGAGGRPLVIIDYAHTPDALEQVLTTIRDHCRQRVICVFGCGGERDREKRPVMGRIATTLADVTIVTDDNPRGENGDDIVGEILAGVRADDSQVSVVRDRAAAITRAVEQARPGDVVLIAGKGHEDYQLTGGQRLDFSDRRQVEDVLQGKAYG